MAPKSKADRLAELEAQRKAIESEADDDDEYEYEIGSGDKYARVSSKSKAGRRINSFFKDNFGINLDDEAEAEDDEDEGGEGKPKGKGKPAAKGEPGSNVRAFGRRIS